MLNHQGVLRGRWQLSLGSYRSTLGNIGGMQIPERPMYTLTMNENVFIVLEDPAAPTRAEIALPMPDVPLGSQPQAPPAPSHYRNTLVTVSPPGALEQLLSQLRARWVSVRQPNTSNSGQKGQGAVVQQLTVDGLIFSIGNDWLVRFGHVILAGGAVRGMLIEAEYLPLPVLHTETVDGSSELLSNLLASMLPMIPDAKIVGVTVSDAVWEEVLGDIDDGLEQVKEVSAGQGSDEDDVFVSPDDLPSSQNEDWVFFGRSMNEDRLIRSANYVRTELPVRIAHRLRDMQALPYVVVNQEGVAAVYEAYWAAFDKFRRYPPISTLEENDAFCGFVRSLLDEHKAVIPNLSLGLSLSSPYLDPDRLDPFMHRMLVSRISRRVLAEHHIALSKHLAAKRKGHTVPDDRVGVIHLGLCVKDSIEKCARFLRRRPFDVDQDCVQDVVQDVAWSDVIIDGHMDTKFSYIQAHLEYIVFELLKNSFRATRLRHPKNRQLPPIRATIVAGDNDVTIRISDQGGGLLTPGIKHPSDLFSFSHVRNPARLDVSRLGALRIVSSSGRGMTATVDEQLDVMRNSTEVEDPQQNAGVSPHPRIGIGLPMSNIFATYFGGSLELVSLDGYGTDVYLRLPKLGTSLEGIEL
ncbi:uncharacterized protein FIBRA_03633 [Fibroporia radiculosa]|uniref:Protein-serine/threonine kinase n=1 Tax=Fibroporia radiculosa TaxID=599839 RepID=J4G631_9APHY|nr:uncharacterized protein FIBRA_03633 [Fibroporia radiculosa]CCM01573.1 predicted protein [Fibroporia radiculosa]